jgi:RNA polymerase sigma factor (TIGR02999 family)
MTHFLEKLAGEPARLDERLYSELKSVAAACLRGERADHTFAPTDLLHEACLRLPAIGSNDSRPAAEIRRLAARTMRRILVDHARRRSTEKRDASRRVVLGEDVDFAVARDEYVVALEGALAALAELDDQLVATVELLFFGGCTVEETARTLEVSPRTVKRRWSLAKGWLHRKITDDAGR